jgi:acetyl esterase/lipase
MANEDRVASFPMIDSISIKFLTHIVVGCCLVSCGNGSRGAGNGTGGGPGYSGGPLATGGGMETDRTAGSGGQTSTGGATSSGGMAGTGGTTMSAGSTTTGGATPSAGSTGGAPNGGGSRDDGGVDSAIGGSDAGAGAGAGGTTGGARTITNVYYAGGTSASQALDLLLPANARLPLPVIIRFHGGGFSAGQKEPEESGTAAKAILAKGYALASVNYRLSGEALFPAGTRDAKAAVRWLRAHAAEYGLDTAHFAAWGESAGGYLAVMLGVTGDQATVFDDDTLGNPGISSAVAAVVDWYGPTDLATMDSQQAAHPPASCPTTWLQHTPAGSPEAGWLGGALDTSAVSLKLAQANLTAYVATARTLPPFIIAHGDNDCQVPWSQSQELKDALAKVGNTATLTILVAASHADARFESTQTAPSLALLALSFR